MGKKAIVSVTYENERVSIKNCLPYLKCGPRADLRPFYGFLCKRFSIYRENTNPFVIFLDFHSTKQGLPLVDSWSRGLD